MACCSFFLLVEVYLFLPFLATTRLVKTVAANRLESKLTCECLARPSHVGTRHVEEIDVHAIFLQTKRFKKVSNRSLKGKGHALELAKKEGSQIQLPNCHCMT